MNDEPIDNLEVDSSCETKPSMFISGYCHNHLEKYSDKKYLLVDFQLNLKSEKIVKLFDYFQKEVYQTDTVLCGYVTDILKKLFDLCPGEMMNFFCKNKTLFTKMILHIDDYSIAEFLFSFSLSLSLPLSLSLLSKC